jgi:hypothetical protein
MLAPGFFPAELHVPVSRPFLSANGSNIGSRIECGLKRFDESKMNAPFRGRATKRRKVPNLRGFGEVNTDR